MAAADPPAGLMDIASTLPRDEIPMKLRCSICNTLAVNAFRLPCCDQSICEPCQTSLSDTCPVCAHTPVSPDVCKPNKALRTTLKAYLRTEEKKREKERQANATSTPTIPTPAESEQAPKDNTSGQTLTESAPAEALAAPVTQEPTSEHPAAESGLLQKAENTLEANGQDTQQPIAESVEAVGDYVPEPATSADTNAHPIDGDGAAPDTSTEPAAQETPQQGEPNGMSMNAGGFSNMGWNGNGMFNGMNPFMGNSMFNFQNPTGMPMGMDPMAASQGMFGDYGMNMTGMGMNMGMNYDGQGMYGSVGWDGSQQNMWQGGQDKFNPNAFANPSGPPYGGAFGGSNMSYPSNADYQPNYYGTGFGRGGFRGRGRGQFHSGPGRGGFGGNGQGNFANAASHGLPNRPFSNGSMDGTNGDLPDGAPPSQANENTNVEQVADGDETLLNDKPEAMSTDKNTEQLQGIPTIDSLDESTSMGPAGYPGSMGPGYGGGGYMRGPMSNGRGGGFWGGPMAQPHMEPRNPGVEGAPAAPRAMRQGLPNTSVLRQRGFHQGRPSIGSNTPGPEQSSNTDAPEDLTQSRSQSKAPSQPPQAEPRSRSRSPAQNQVSRAHSPSAHVPEEDRQSRRDRDVKRLTEGRSRSPSGASSRRSSRHRHRDSDRERERRSGHRSHRSRRHQSRSRSRSITRNGDSRQADRLASIAEDRSNGPSKTSAKINPRDLASRIGNAHRTSKDRPSRREEDRDRDRDRDRTRDSRHRERAKDRDRERDRRDRDRDSERDNRRDREHEREQGRDRGKDRKRSRRDRSESANNSDHSSHPRARRVKRGTDDRTKERETPTAAPEPEKDPHTLEREARNRERLLREEQRREQAKSGHRRESRKERVVAGRRINYKYEDEL
ncbi:hypothetical protein N7478_006085 [Penicillium angulare]|uniref:uncharacterized protein n=1 Tax=Penicillium angulare TaxID=116970 RepID=UPI002541BA80|nr:uncharacterized protein N7478_006085 [Penicillium angulare]KAJ5280713.1 hypothetical protein N7478_006085 [Penicillium angulare]